MIHRVDLPEPYVIAEVANAHGGDFSRLLAMIEAVKTTGAQGIKFQWFQADTLAMPDFEWYPVYKTLAFSSGQWREAVDRARHLELDVWVDVTDEWALSQIATCANGVFGLKIPPSALLDRRLSAAAAAVGKPVIVGLGGHDDPTIEQEVGRLRAITPALILEHGFQAYPTKPDDATLRRIGWLRSRYGLSIGFADHEAGDSELALRLPEYAYFAGATVIEKHICLDRSARPYDYYSSLEPGEFRTMVENLRRCRVVMGGLEITEAQRKYLTVASRAVMRVSVEAGETITASDIHFRRTAMESAMTPDVADRTMPAVAVQSLATGQPLRAVDCCRHKIVAVVPCRMKSSRLKHKAILSIAGISSIQRCLINTKAISGLAATVLATSVHPDDAVLEAHAREAGVEFLCGSEEDVLERCLTVADRYQADILLRITGDCPVVSYEIADLLIRSHLETKADLTYCQPPFAVGTNCDVYRVSALRRLRALVPNTNYSEYMSFYFINNPALFKLNPITLPQAYQRSEWRLTLDEQADLDLFETLFSELGIGREPISFAHISGFFARHPDAAQINGSIKLSYVADPNLVAKLKQVTSIPVSEVKAGRIS